MGVGFLPADEPPRLARPGHGVPVRRRGDAEGVALGDRLAEQLDQRVVDARVLDAGRGEEKLHVATSPSRGKQPPVPLGDDLDGAVDHPDRGLVVDRVRRAAMPGGPRSRRWPSCCRAGPGGRGAGRSRSRPAPSVLSPPVSGSLSSKVAPRSGSSTMLPALMPDLDRLGPQRRQEVGQAGLPHPVAQVQRARRP